MKRFLLLLILLAGLQGHVFAQPEDSPESTIMMKMLVLKISMIAKDSVSLSNVLSDDVSFGHTNGLIQTKAQLIRSVMSKEQDYLSIDPSDMNIRVYDEAAVVTLKSKVKMNYKEKPLELDMFITLVWIKKNNKWVLVARQAVKLV